MDDTDARVWQAIKITELEAENERLEKALIANWSDELVELEAVLGRGLSKVELQGSGYE